MMIIPINTNITIITVIYTGSSDNFTWFTKLGICLILLRWLFEPGRKSRNWESNVEIGKEENYTTNNHNYIPKVAKMLFHCRNEHYQESTEGKERHDKYVAYNNFYVCTMRAECKARLAVAISWKDEAWAVMFLYYHCISRFLLALLIFYLL